jgi:drug/metabolite transporter (DMT)-like permease
MMNTLLPALTGSLGEAWPILALLMSALLHASWNAAVRAKPDPAGSFASVVMGAGIWSLLALAVLPLPNLAAWPWILVSCIFNVASMRAMMAAYRRAPFSLAYPVTRAGMAPFVLLLGFALFGEWPRAMAVLGIGLIVCALAGLAWAGTQRSHPTSPPHHAAAAGDQTAEMPPRTTMAGLWFALLAAMLGAGFVVADAKGARLAESILGYAAVVAIVNAALLPLTLIGQTAKPLHLFTRQWRFGLSASFVSMTSYILFVWPLTVVPVAVASALRETSMIFALVIAALFLRERIGPVQAVSILLAALGVVVIRLS